ncbi:MAG TPA: NAD(P)H oxidoreductase [Gammaproteobacteria bacterium]|nr:NAD(P)H oxidoreductase [Gammaproteobacteria bacterium]
MTPRRRILILFAHPAFEKSVVNRHLLAAAQRLAGVHVHDLYEIYPDFCVDVPREQALLAEHDVIVFHHPFYWYSTPALLKEWQDLVLEYGFAYGRQGTALHGKWLLTATTTGGERAAYDGVSHPTMSELLAPFRRTADLCGMRYLPPFVVHATDKLHRSPLLDDAATRYATCCVPCVTAHAWTM